MVCPSCCLYGLVFVSFMSTFMMINNLDCSFDLSNWTPVEINYPLFFNLYFFLQFQNDWFERIVLGQWKSCMDGLPGKLSIWTTVTKFHKSIIEWMDSTPHWCEVTWLCFLWLWCYHFIEWQNAAFIMQDIYCLDADGALFDAALLSAVASLSHCK